MALGLGFGGDTSEMYCDRWKCIVHLHEESSNHVQLISFVRSYIRLLASVPSPLDQYTPPFPFLSVVHFSVPSPALRLLRINPIFSIFK